MERHKHYIDQKRYEHCRKCRRSGKIVSKYAKEIARLDACM